MSKSWDVPPRCREWVTDRIELSAKQHVKKTDNLHISICHSYMKDPASTGDLGFFFLQHNEGASKYHIQVFVLLN